MLGIESSCDDLAMCILDTPNIVVAHQVASQTLHTTYGGIVPEVASREHLKTLNPVFDALIQQSNISISSIEGISVTCKPGLIGSLLVGLNFAKGLALSMNVPFVGINHLEGHLLSVFLEEKCPHYPFLGMVLSGGHTHLYLVEGLAQRTLLGCTVDDAAGEAYDKVAKMLGLPYPGGPILDQLAQRGNPKAFSFKIAQVKRGNLYTSFSGLKTAVLEVIEQQGWRNILLDKKAEEVSGVCDLIASFQYTLVKSIERIFTRAHQLYPNADWALAGGVACNSEVRKTLFQAAEKRKRNFYVPAPKWCTDNAAMIAYVGGQYLEKGIRSDWKLNAQSGS